MPAWKDDFPVSWVDDHYVTRREFTKSLIVASCAAFAANGVLVATDLLDRNAAAEPPEPVRAGSAEELPVGSSKVFRFLGAPCLLIRLEADRFAAYGQKCTHLGCPVVYRREARDLQCPCHEGYFSAEDGRVLSGPPPRPLPRVELERRGAEVWAVGVGKS